MGMADSLLVERTQAVKEAAVKPAPFDRREEGSVMFQGLNWRYHDLT
jgi:hypothetical protein